MANADRSAEQFRKMTETPIPKLILSLAAPTILSMLITSIYNLADTFFVGQISTSASGAVGIVSSLMAILQALGFMLGHGSGSIISRSLGSQNTDAATRFASTSFFTALVFGGTITVAGLLTLPDFMMLLGSTETILPHACAYARYILLAAPIMMSSLVMNNILRYEGKASFAMIGLVTGGLLNIALDPLFIFGLGMGTAGAGLATALSQTISFCILLSMFLRGKTVSQFRITAVTHSPAEFGTILMTGMPSFGRQGLNSIGGMLLNIAARGIELADGDNIITTNLEFIQVALPWCVMRREKKIEIRVCKTKDNRFTVDDFAALADERTRIIVMSTLEWCNGWASDMKAIGDFCQEKGIFLVVDAVQQLGVTKIDTKECHFDLLVAGGHKWLNSPYGTGVLYVNKNSLSKIKQSYAGYLNTTVPEGGWGAYWENPAAPSVHDWTFPETARKYEIGGTSNYTGAIALGESLGLVNEIGIENIQEHIWELSAYCMDQLEAIGATIITHRDPGRRGGIVIARLYDDLDVDRWVLKQLHARKIFIAQRFTDYVGGFRISCQYFNNHADIDAMAAAMKELIQEIGRAPDYKAP